MKIEFNPRASKWQRYPWDKMKEVGDYFDVPASTVGGRVTTAAYHRQCFTGYKFHCFHLENGDQRCILVYIEPGALRV